MQLTRVAVYLLFPVWLEKKIDEEYDSVLD